MKNRKKGFSLVELVIIIAIVAILIAVLAPSLMTYTERSRSQKDATTMDEVVNAVQLAMADQKCYDEMIKYSCNNNFITYTDSSGNYGQVVADGEFWAPDGAGRATTITFNPTRKGNETYYVLETGIINDMTYGNGSVAENRVMEGAQTEQNQCYFKNTSLNGGDITGYTYNRVRQAIGDSVITTSATYANSSFTIFIRFNQRDGATVADVNGSFNGTNLTADSAASKGSGTLTYDPNTGAAQPTITTPGKTESNFTSSALQGGGSFSPDYTPDYKQDIDITVEDDKPKGPQAGLYDADDNLIADWDTLVNTYNLDISIDYTTSTYKTANTSLYCVLNNYNELSDGVKLVIDNSVTNIGECALYKCTNLTSITIGDSVTTIGNNAFGYCESLTSVTIPDSVTSIGSAFRYCSSITNLTIPESVTSIGNSAFAYCTNLQSVNIPNGITAINASVFYHCEHLTEITIPDGVTTIGNEAFYACYRLKPFIIPDSVTYIGNRAFWNCLSLTHMTIPDSVTSVGELIFVYCYYLESVHIGSGLKEISYGMFRNCTRLKSVNIPDGVTRIRGNAFDQCTSLTSIIIPDSVLRIDDSGAFKGCTSLTSVTMGKGIQRIGKEAFADCTSLVTFMYTGTSAQFSKIKGGMDWARNVPAEEIIFI